MPALRLDQVQAFVILAEELHFTRAAERMFLSQPGLSRRLAALEAVVGCRLLHRTNKDVHLTATGEAFLPFAMKFIQLARDCLPALEARRRPQLNPVALPPSDETVGPSLPAA